VRISKATLKAARPENLRRLAKWIGLHVPDDMSHNQLAKLVYWRITRREKQYRYG